MKKIICVLMCLLLCTSLSACSKSNPTLKCEIIEKDDELGMTTYSEVEISFKDDLPSYIDLKMEMNMGKDNKEYVDLAYYIFLAAIKDIDKNEVKIDTSKTDESIIVKFGLDLTKADLLEQFDIEIDPSQSRDLLKSELEKEGFTCK